MICCVLSAHQLIAHSKHVLPAQSCVSAALKLQIYSVYLGWCTSGTRHFDGLEAVVFTRLYDKFNFLSFPQTPKTFRFDCGLQLADEAVVTPAGR